MVKLSRNEIETAIEQENVLVDLPRDAHSVFRFEIKETSADLLKEMKELPKKHLPDVRKIDKNGEVKFYKGSSKADWEYQEVDDKHIQLNDPDFWSHAEVEIVDGGLDITTAFSNYNYKIKDKRNGKGAEVEFHGPVNGLLRQNLLPSMTYVPHTLQGKFVDAESKESLTDYMDMHTFGIIRAAKNKKIIEGSYDYSENRNTQDVYASEVNRQFNNEIDFLPKHLSRQEYENMKAQKRFEKGDTESFYSIDKEIIQERLEAAKGKVSGVVKADKQAEEIISAMVSKKLQNRRE